MKVDDILVSGVNDADHLNNLSKVFHVLEEMGATVNKKKFKFFASEVDYVGFIVDKNGIRTDPKKIKAIIHIAEPNCVKELQSFIGGINYYSRFIQNMATIAKPLYRLIEKETAWRWTSEEQSAFDELKLIISESPVLCLYELSLPLILACDASY